MQHMGSERALNNFVCVCQQGSAYLKKGDKTMDMMQCIALRSKINKAEDSQKTIDESNLKWHFDRMVRLLDSTPDSVLSMDARNASYSFKRAYRADGINGGLVHANWLIAALKHLSKNAESGDLLWEAESTAIALNIEW